MLLYLNSMDCSFNCGNKARVQCKCKNPSVALCPSCMGFHFQTESKSAHLMVPIEECTKDPSEPCCAECSGNLGKVSLICLCSNKKTLLCKQCCSVHIENNSTASHIFEHIENTKFLNSEEEVKDYLLRNRIIDIIASQLEANQKTAAIQKQNIESAKQMLIQHIQTAFEFKIKELEEVEEYVETIRTQLQECRLSKPSSNKDSWMHQLLQRCTLRNINEEVGRMKLVLIDLNISDIILEVNKLNETTQFAKRPFHSNITYLKPYTNEVYFFDLKSEKPNKLAVGENVTFCNDAAWCSLPNGDVFYCGGFEKSAYSDSACILSIVDLKLKELPRMNSSREGHAASYYNGGVYIFGGYNGSYLSQCEKYDIEKECWISLPRMSEARYCFTATTLENKIYLGGGNYTDTLEVFDLLTCTFTSLSVKLPYSNQYTLIASLKGTVLIFQREKLTAYEPSRNQMVELREVESSSWWSNMSVTEYDSHLFILHHLGQVWKFDPDSMDIKQILKF